MAEDAEEIMNRTVEVSLDEVLRVFRTLEKLQQFFHQPLHYPDIGAVEEFLGNRNSGAFKDINDLYYGVVWNWLPADVQREIEES